MLFKKIVNYSLLFLFLLFLSACSDEKIVEEVSTPKKYKVGFIEYNNIPAFQKMRDGLFDTLKEHGYDESNMDIHFENAEADLEKLNAIAKESRTANYDFIISITTPAVQAIMAIDELVTEKTPLFFMAVANPLFANVTTNMQKPNKNATGVANPIASNDIIKLARQLTPEAKTFGIIYNEKEIHSYNTAKSTENYLKTFPNLGYETILLASEEDLKNNLPEFLTKIDALFIPNDTFFQSKIKLISSMTNERSIPIYCCADTAVEGGALATVAMENYEVGTITAGLIIEYLKGKKIEEIPIVIAPSEYVTINQDVVDFLDITIPDSIVNPHLVRTVR